MLKHVPNILTLARFVLIPIIIKYLIVHNYVMAFVFLTISGLTDVLDGFIARKFNLISDFGKLIDPFADKATQICILATLCIQEVIPVWILIVILLKEFIMITGACFVYGKDFVVSSKWYGKCATVLFYIAIVLSLLLNQFRGIILDYQYSKMLSGQIDFTSRPPFILYIDKPFYYLAIIATIFSLIMYFYVIFARRNKLIYI